MAAQAHKHPLRKRRPWGVPAAAAVVADGAAAVACLALLLPKHRPLQQSPRPQQQCPVCVLGAGMARAKRAAAVAAIEVVAAANAAAPVARFAAFLAAVAAAVVVVCLDHCQQHQQAYDTHPTKRAHTFSVSRYLALNSKINHDKKLLPFGSHIEDWALFDCRSTGHSVLCNALGSKPTVTPSEKTNSYTSSTKIVKDHSNCKTLLTDRR